MRINSASAGAVIIVPVGLAGEPTTTPLSGRTRCCASRLSLVIDQRVAALVSMQDRLAAQRGEDVAIGRIAGHRHRDAIARLESSEKREHEAGRGAGGDDDPLRIDVETVPFGIGARDAPPQRSDAQASRYSHAGPLESAARTAAIAVAGAPAAGWPTSIWTIRRPFASSRAAAAMTSMTINGGTPLRADGCSRLFAFSSITAPLNRAPGRPTVSTAPLMPYSAGFVTRQS